MKDAQKRAEEVYPLEPERPVSHMVFAELTVLQMKEIQQETFIKGYSEGYEKGDKEFNEAANRYYIEKMK